MDFIRVPAAEGVILIRIWAESIIKRKACSECFPDLEASPVPEVPADMEAIRIRGIPVQAIPDRIIRIRAGRGRHRPDISSTGQMVRPQFSQIHRQRQDKSSVRSAVPLSRQAPSSAWSAVRKCRLVRRYALNAANCCRRGRSSAWSAELRFGAEPGKRDEKSRRLHRGVLYRKRTLRCLFSGV